MNFPFPSVLVAVLLVAATTAHAADPKPVKPAAVGSPGTETEIKADGEATFDAENHLAVFSGGVTVTDARFTMKSQKLTVYLSKSREGTGKEDPVGGGIERAIAEGGVDIVQAPRPGATTGDDAQRVTGRAERATFDPKTGVVVLSGSPVVRRGINEHIATAAATTMTLTREGGLRTNGPSKTVIRDTSKVADLAASPAKKP